MLLFKPCRHDGLDHGERGVEHQGAFPWGIDVLHGIADGDRSRISAKTTTDTDDGEIDKEDKDYTLPGVIDPSAGGGECVPAAGTEDKQGDDENEDQH